RQWLNTSRSAEYLAVLGAFRQVATECSKAFQASALQTENPMRGIDLQPYIRSAWEAIDGFGLAIDRAALVASQRARRASVALENVVTDLRTYTPLADGGQSPPSIAELNQNAYAARSIYEDAVTADLRTRSWRERRQGGT
ncbi:MAG TPA: hypothetical protein VGJ86_06170, partial [Acidimicrobiales bacterium]